MEIDNWRAKERNRWMMIASVISAAFIFGLPGFQGWFPYYFNPGNSTSGPPEDAKITISGFISHAPATGLMAMMFFTPIIQMWMIPKPKSCSIHDPYGNNNNDVDVSPCMKASAVICLSFFQIFFGTFLSVPNIYNGLVHGVVVQVFAVNGLIWGCFQVYFLRKHIKKCGTDSCKNNHTWERFSIPLFFLGLGALGMIMIIYGMIVGTFYYAFWFWECIALTGMAMFTPTLMLEFHDTTQMEPLYYDVFSQGCRNVLRILLPIIPTTYILLLPWLSGINYAARADPNNLSIEDYLSGMDPIIPGEDVQGGSTGAANGCMLAVMFFPLLTIWNVTPSSGWKWQQQKRFLVSQVLFTLLFFAHFAWTRETSWHNYVYIAMIISVMLYSLLRFKATKHQCINWITFLWNFGSCIALFIMEYYKRRKNYKFEEKLFIAEVSFYFSIIWTIPFEIINNCNIPSYKIIYLFIGIHSEEVNEKGHQSESQLVAQQWDGSYA